MASAEDTRAQYRAKAAALRREIVEKMSALATAAFGLVAALAWNTAIQSLFKHYYPTPDDPNALAPLVGYAVAVSIIAVLVMLWIGRISARLKDRSHGPAPR
jgi:divalent metal cation (Fe/Co/Zn/Cd) transporter